MAMRLRQAVRLAGFLLAGTLVAGCGGGGGGVAPPADEPAPWRLVAADEARLTAWLREALGPSSPRAFGWGTIAIATGADVAAAPAAPAPAFSGTTLQESGVDEADLIKSDGVHVFSLDPTASGTLSSARTVLRRQRLDAGTPALSPVDHLQLPFSTGMTGAGLYLDEERQQVAALGRKAGGWGVYDLWFSPWSWSEGATEVVLARAPATAPLQARRTLRIAAHLIGSRRIGATLYLVLRSPAQVPGFDPSWSEARTAANRTLLESLQAAQVLPTISVDGGTPQPLVAPSSCLLQESNTQRTADIVTIVGIDLASDRHAARCFVGGTEAFYMSERNLYLATTRTAYGASGGLPTYVADTSTDIHKFALDGLDIAYRGSGNVRGHLGFDQNRKSFRLGEHEGALRVVTQTQEQWIGIPMVIAPSTPATTMTTATTAAIESPARLTVLQERAGALAVVGELPNASRPQPLGKPGEQLYASRFIGARGYLVTYRLIDPLYVLDLSNPADPKLAGELHVEGYSDYLLPVSETLLLGVGKDAVVDGSMGDGRFAWYQGVKVSLIDVSDPARPREADRAIIGRRGTDATVLHDHHGIALQTLGGTVRASLPVSLRETPWPGAPAGPSAWYQFTRTELQRFEIDLAGQRLVTRPALAADVPGERSILQDRSLLWGDQVHWYQGGAWQSAPW